MDAIAYLHLPPGKAPADLPVQPFLAIIVAEDVVDPAWRGRIGHWLVESGCVYVVAWGRDCEAWHDDVDDASIAAFEGGDIPTERSIMTTWHDREPLSEALWFASFAEHPMVDLTRGLIVHIAAEARETELLDAFYESAAA